MYEYLYQCRHLRSELLKLDKQLRVGECFVVPIKNDDLSSHGVHQRSFSQLKYALQNVLRNFDLQISCNELTMTKCYVERTYEGSGDIGILIVTDGRNDLQYLLKYLTR